MIRSAAAEPLEHAGQADQDSARKPGTRVPEHGHLYQHLE